MTMITSIRTATADDKELVNELMLELYVHEHKFTELKAEITTAAEFIRMHLDEWFTKPDHVILIAEQEGKAVGYIFGWRQYISEAFRNAYVGYISDCYVREEQRKQGIGRKLLEAILDVFRTWDLKEAKLIVFSANPSLKAWERLGFTEEITELRRLL